MEEAGEQRCRAEQRRRGGLHPGDVEAELPDAHPADAVVDARDAVQQQVLGRQPVAAESGRGDGDEALAQRGELRREGGAGVLDREAEAARRRRERRVLQHHRLGDQVDGAVEQRVQPGQLGVRHRLLNAVGELLLAAEPRELRRDREHAHELQRLVHPDLLPGLAVDLDQAGRAVGLRDREVGLALRQRRLAWRRNAGSGWCARCGRSSGGVLVHRLRLGRRLGGGSGRGPLPRRRGLDHRLRLVRHAALGPGLRRLRRCSDCGGARLGADVRGPLRLARHGHAVERHALLHVLPLVLPVRHRSRLGLRRHRISVLARHEDLLARVHIGLLEERHVELRVLHVLHHAAVAHERPRPQLLDRRGVQRGDARQRLGRGEHAAHAGLELRLPGPLALRGGEGGHHHVQRVGQAVVGAGARRRAHRGRHRLCFSK